MNTSTEKRKYSSIKNWAIFDKNKKSHRQILSCLRQLGWTKPHDKYGEVADMNRLSDWLKSKKSPVQKPLQNMQKPEVSKIIVALESMTGKQW